MATGLFAQSAVSLARGSRLDEPEAVLDRWTAGAGAVLAPRARAQVLQSLIAVDAMLDQLWPSIDEHGIDVTALLRDMGRVAESPQTHPRRSLRMHCSGLMMRDVARKRLRSDWLDIEHLGYFPYVDVATCDGNTHKLFEIARRDIDLPRDPTVIRSGRLEQFDAAIEALPPPYARSQGQRVDFPRASTASRRGCYVGCMSAVGKLIAEALALPVPERAELLALVAQSLPVYASESGVTASPAEHRAAWDTWVATGEHGPIAEGDGAPELP